MISLTPKAIEKAEEIIAAQPNSSQIKGLRMAVQGGGCSGFQYSLTLQEEEPSPDDRILEFENLKVFVDQKSLLYLMGTQLDYVEGLAHSGFRFNNPNATGTCGCGESFSA